MTHLADRTIETEENVYIQRSLNSASMGCVDGLTDAESLSVPLQPNVSRMDSENIVCMTTRLPPMANLELLGTIFEATDHATSDLQTFGITHVDMGAYEPAVRNAHLDALNELDLIGLIYEFSADPSPKQVKFIPLPKLRELAEKIRQSGGWKLVIERWGLDKILIGMTVKEFVEFLSKLLG